MTPLLFDIIIVGLLILSAGLGFLRGFCNEVFTIFGWMGAVIATIYFTPVARDYGRQLIKKAWLADIATAGTIFLVTLALFSVVSYFATRTLQASKLNILDRAMGFAFGVLRGIVLLGLSFYLFTYVFADPDQRPDFIQHARTRPFLEASAAWSEIFLPKEIKSAAVAVGNNTSTSEPLAADAQAVLKGGKAGANKADDKTDTTEPASGGSTKFDNAVPKEDGDINKDDLMSAKTKLQNIIKQNDDFKKKKEDE